MGGGLKTRPSILVEPEEHIVSHASGKDDALETVRRTRALRTGLRLQRQTPRMGADVSMRWKLRLYDGDRHIPRGAVTLAPRN